MALADTLDCRVHSICRSVMRQLVNLLLRKVASENLGKITCSAVHS
jgi:hypothetical protein